MRRKFNRNKGESDLWYKKYFKQVQIKFLKTQPWKISAHDSWYNSHHKHNLKTNSIKVEANDDVLLLRFTIDKKLTFKQHIENLCPKGQYKVHTLRRIRKFLTIEKTKILDNAFIDSQFKCAPLLWMFCRKNLYSKIEKIFFLKATYRYNVTRSLYMKGILDFE